MQMKFSVLDRSAKCDIYIQRQEMYRMKLNKQQQQHKTKR